MGINGPVCSIEGVGWERRRKTNKQGLSGAKKLSGKGKESMRLNRRALSQNPPATVAITVSAKLIIVLNSMIKNLS